jgi:cytochrome P450
MHVWQKIALGLLAVFVALHVREFINEIIYRRQAKKAGCGLPTTTLDRPFGFPTVMKLRYAMSQNKALNFFRDLFVKYDLLTVRCQNTFDLNIITVDPENVKSVLATNFKDYSLGIRYNQLLPLLGNGIFTLSGEGWKHSRAMLRPQFTREQVSHLDSLNMHVQRLIDVFRAKSKGGQYFDCQVEFHNLTIDTATEFLFGESVDSLSSLQRRVQGPTRQVSAAEFADSFNYCQDKLALRTHVGPLHWLVDGFEFRRRISICHNFVDYFVGKALAHPLNPGEEAKGPYVFIRELTRETRDPRVIRDQAFNILLAGRDTTASLLSFVIYYLVRHKDVWQKLREAVLAEYGENIENMSFESLKRCTYLMNVINEVLRLHPIVPLNFRTAIRDTVLPRGGGPDGDEPVFVPKGTKVIYTMWTTQRLKKFWGEDADDFRPDRWTESKLHTWDYLPFNGGPRICIGQQFALTEAAYTLVRICQTFKDVTTTNTDDYHDIGQWLKLTTSVAHGVPVNFVEA